MDNDCDGLVDTYDDTLDETTLLLLFRDADEDGFGEESDPVVFCTVLPMTSVEAGDCDDLDPSVHPAALEICDELDNNCNGEVDAADRDLDASSGAWFYPDGDGDGYGDPDGELFHACADGEDSSENAEDCEDADPAVHPGATEVCDGKDNNCDGLGLAACGRNGVFDFESDDRRLSATDLGGSLGLALDAAGDVDGDGLADLLVISTVLTGSPTVGGYTSVVYGGVGLADSDISAAGPRFVPTAADGTMSAVAHLGDVNGDGVGDFATSSVGSPSMGAPVEGHVYLFFGGSRWSGDADLLGAADVVWETGLVDGNFFGGMLASAGDVDGDGFGDAIIGSPAAHGGRGAVQLVFGQGTLSGGVLSSSAVLEIDGTQAFGFFAESGTTNGDFDGDGLSDLVFGEWGFLRSGQTVGRAYLYMAPGIRPTGVVNASSMDATWDWDGGLTSARLGMAADAADWTGDGYDDLGMSAPYGDANGAVSGGVYFFWGGASGWSGTLPTSGADLVVTGSAGYGAGRYFGDVGDTDIDGWGEVAIDAVGYRDGDDFGATFVLSPGIWSGTVDVTTASLFRVVGTSETLYHRNSAGDIDGDGASDLVIARQQFDSQRGTVSIFAGWPGF